MANRTAHSRMRQYALAHFTHRIHRFVEEHCQGNWAEAARKAGIPLTSLQKLKEGGDPRTSTLTKLSEGWGVSLDWLVKGNVANDCCRVEEPAAVYSTGSPDELLARERWASGVIVEQMRRHDVHFSRTQFARVVAVAVELNLAEEWIGRLVELFKEGG